MTRSFSHITSRYIFDRFSVFIFEKFHPDAPWFTPKAVSILSGWLKSTDVGLEWGSGRSTLWFARRVANLRSIEHDPKWYMTIKSRLESQHLTNVDYRLHLIRNPKAIEEHESRAYVGAAEDIPERSMDFVLVDGMCRAACTSLALRLLKPSGLLIIDNANWYLPHSTRSPASMKNNKPRNEEWANVAQHLSKWREIWTSSGVSDTAFYVRPSE